MRPAALKIAQPQGTEGEEGAEPAQRKVDQRNFDSKLGWREALGFEHPIKGWQNLWIRFATNLDVKKEDTKAENSRFYKFAQRTAQLSREKKAAAQRGSRSTSRYGSHPGDREGDRRDH